jgi:hypothetical protein
MAGRPIPFCSGQLKLGLGLGLGHGTLDDGTVGHCLRLGLGLQALADLAGCARDALAAGLDRVPSLLRVGRLPAQDIAEGVFGGVQLE